MDEAEFECYLERSVVVLTRHNRYFFGRMKSYDQYNTISLDHTCERVFCGGEYGERRHGLVVLRGENILLVGAEPPKLPSTLKKRPFDAVCAALAKEQAG